METLEFLKIGDDLVSAALFCFENAAIRFCKLPGEMERTHPKRYEAEQHSYHLSLEALQISLKSYVARNICHALASMIEDEEPRTVADDDKPLQQAIDALVSAVSTAAVGDDRVAWQSRSEKIDEAWAKINQAAMDFARKHGAKIPDLT